MRSGLAVAIVLKVEDLKAPGFPDGLDVEHEKEASKVITRFGAPTK